MALGLSEMAAGSVLLSVVTTLPELSVSALAAISGEGGLSVGNVLGSNVANLTIITGLAVFFSKTLVSLKEESQKELVQFLFISSIIPLFIVQRGTLSPVLCLVLLIPFGFFSFVTSRKTGKIESRAYWKVKTNEGYGVLHVLFVVVDDRLPRKRKKGMLISKRRRGFVPHSWLSKTWEKIHGAKVVEIHELKGKKSEKDIAYYVVGNYVSKQPAERMSYSHKWVCVGFSKKWKTFLEIYWKKAVEA